MAAGAACGTEHRPFEHRADPDHPARLAATPRRKHRGLPLPRPRLPGAGGLSQRRLIGTVSTSSPMRKHRAFLSPSRREATRCRSTFRVSNSLFPELNAPGSDNPGMVPINHGKFGKERFRLFEDNVPR